MLNNKNFIKLWLSLSIWINLSHIIYNIYNYYINETTKFNFVAQDTSSLYIFYIVLYIRICVWVSKQEGSYDDFRIFMWRHNFFAILFFYINKFLLFCDWYLYNLYADTISLIVFFIVYYSISIISKLLIFFNKNYIYTIIFWLFFKKAVYILFLVTILILIIVLFTISVFIIFLKKKKK